MIVLYERVAERAQAGGLSITAEVVAKVDQLLGEERFAMMRAGSAKEIKESHAPSVEDQEARDHVA